MSGSLDPGINVVVLTDVAQADIDAVVSRLRGAWTDLGLERSASVSVVFASDAELADLNERFRGLAQPTDVLSFPSGPADPPRGQPMVEAGETMEFSEDGEDGEGVEGVEGVEDGGYLGDVIISVAYAARTAAAGNRALSSELELLAVHGLLHLLGHDDATDAGAERMRDLETRLGVRDPADTG